jgi:hypothetical protein
MPEKIVNELGFAMNAFDQTVSVTLADVVQELGACADFVSRCTHVRQFCVSMRLNQNTQAAPVARFGMSLLALQGQPRSFVPVSGQSDAPFTLQELLDGAVAYTQDMLSDELCFEVDLDLRRIGSDLRQSVFVQPIYGEGYSDRAAFSGSYGFFCHVDASAMLFALRCSFQGFAFETQQRGGLHAHTHVWIRDPVVSINIERLLPGEVDLPLTHRD